jgi:hypothetical protein
MTRDRQTPCARQARLLIEELPDEVLVYDLDRKRAHCLNRTAALVWKHCDGRATVADICFVLQHELKEPIDEQTVWLALNQLDKARLLRERLANPDHRARISRRDVIRRVGLAAATLPLVTSILAPTAQAQASCKTAGQLCASQAECCPGLQCVGSPKHCA